MKTKEQIREKMEHLIVLIERDQESLINSIKYNIQEVSDTKVALLDLKRRIDKEYLDQRWILLK